VAAGHGQHIAGAPAFQAGAQPRVAAVDLIGGDPGRRGSGIQGPGDHLARQRGLGREPSPGRDARGAAAGPVISPGPGQVKLAVDQGMTGQGSPTPALISASQIPASAV
jgi:hypothetical protein